MRGVEGGIKRWGMEGGKGGDEGVGDREMGDGGGG